MKIAVTSASGNLGSRILKACIKEAGAENVVALARTPENVSVSGVEVRIGDYSDYNQLVTSLTGIDAVLLISGNSAPEERIPLHKNVIDAAAAAGVRKIVYTSIQGLEEESDFSGIVRSNRTTEKDIRESGLDFVIGRNGLYIEPDVEYIESYKKMGVVSNCAGEGLCGYVAAEELAFAYARMLTEEKHNGKTYNLSGESITQPELVEYLNQAFGCKLSYKFVDAESYKKERQEEIGEFIGMVIAGIYQTIALGGFNNPSDFELATGRPHISWQEYFRTLD